MRAHSLPILLSFLAVVDAHNHHHNLHKRQATTSRTQSASSATPTPSPSQPPAQAGPATGIFGLTSGKPPEPTVPLSTTYAPGATPPIKGAPPLPTPFVFKKLDWPEQDHIPDVNSPEVQNWMLELEGFNIPDIPPTVGDCSGPSGATAAQNRWWSCGGHTSPLDIVACPDKYTWGVSFDDGPSPYTPTLLKYLAEKSIRSTFFVVGSRVVERPAMLIDEYMSGHEIAVHTWSHKKLTTLTNEQVVAELGWTRAIIQRVLGVTPVFMRAPFGDIDDRVRAISLAMGMRPIIWTRTPSGKQFDTNDWMVPAGNVTGAQSFQLFQTILQDASALDTGFIVLQHDLYDTTVELATKYTLPAAMEFQPPLTLKNIGACAGIPPENLYFETTKDKSFPYRNNTRGGYDINGDGKIETLKSGSGRHTPVLGLVTLLCAAVLAASVA